VILKVGNTGAFRSVTNGTTSLLKVYPPVGGKLNNAAANAAFSLNPNRACWCFFLSSTVISTNGW
jgi:hypothetical protein